MKRDHWIVTPERGPRPAGPPDECLYCRAKLGQEHRRDCVMRVKTVRISVTLDVVIGVPEDWDEEMVRFRYEGSSYCCDNLIHGLSDHVEARTKGGFPCLCDNLKVTAVRDATAEDHETLGVCHDEDGIWKERT